MVEKFGVCFCFNSMINSFIFKNDVVCGVLVDGQLIDVDLVVVVLGSYSMLFLKNLVNVLVYLFKGFLIIVLMMDVEKSFVFIILDEIYKVVVMCFDDCICVGGMVQIVGYDKCFDLGKCKMLEFVVNDLFLGVGDVLCVLFWIGLCLMMLDGMFIVGQMFVCGLWFNMGYGMLGWIMVCGLGKLLLDLVFGCLFVICLDDLLVYCYLGGMLMLVIKFVLV